MNKIKKSDTKKILVRNTALPVPKTRLIVEEKSKNNEENEKETKTQEAKLLRPKLHVPEMNSALKIGEKIDKVQKTKAQKLQKVAVCEKVTRKMNFPADKPIYKNLVPLQVPTRSPPILISRDPFPQKDREPQLVTYAGPPYTKEYVHIPSVKSEIQPVSSQLNNLRLYQIIQMNTL